MNSLPTTWLLIFGLASSASACQVNGRSSDGGSAPGSTQASAAHERHLLLVVQRDPSGFHVHDSKVVESAVPVPRVVNEQPWRVDIEDAQANRLYSVGMPQKGLLRGEFAGADGGIEAVHLTPETFAFVVRVPLLASARRIRFFQAAGGAASAGSTQGVGGDRGIELGSMPYPAVAP